jgi:hypothetical protein
MKQAQTDPRVSCPIVCGEYMRASGFFFAIDTQTYLITARHNLLPVNAATLATGDWPLDFETEDSLPTIDLYLQDTHSRVQHRIDIRDTPGVRFNANLDVVGIPIDLTPQDYGYTVWTPTDISSPESIDNSTDSLGFPGYSLDPHVLTLQTKFPGPSQLSIDTGLIEIGFDTDTGTQSSEYNGFSGSPILGDGLVGIHMSNQKVSAIGTNTGSSDEEMMILYWRADVLPQLLSS